MQKLLDIINKLAEKYKFDESEVKEIQQAVFNLEQGDHELESDAEDFTDPFDDEKNMPENEDEDGYV